MNFNLDKAIKIANQCVYLKFNRNLTDIEILILKGAWEREEYDAIAAKNQYATSYISQDVAPKLWKYLTESLGEKVKKSNFKEALRRQWEKRNNSPDNNFLKEDTYHDYPSLNQEIAIVSSPNHHSYSSIEGIKLIPKIYIERPPIESICIATIKQSGSLVRIKAPSLMGKTYLIEKIIAEISKYEYRSASLSFELADSSIHFQSLNKFLRWFCINLSRELGLPNEIDEYWDEEGIGAKVSCTTYFEEYLLAQINVPLVIYLDDVDLLFPYPQIYEDFFGLLRSWYEKARSRKTWQKLRLVLAHATDVYIRLNINQSPFNVGLPIELSEFTIEQVMQLVREHSLVIDINEIELLIQLIGGHPYLLEQAFLYLKINPQVNMKDLLKQAITDAGIYGHHLREHWLDIQQKPELVTALQKIITSTHPIQIEPVLAYQLNSIGLVKLTGNKVEPRCDLYRQYFRMHFGQD